MVANPPKKHHYIPSFYTSQWAGADKQLCVFRKNPYKGLVHRRLAPAATGYQCQLYDSQLTPLEDAKGMEEEFFRPVDTAASEALSALVAGVNPDRIGQRKREAWARFMLSLLLRCPEDLIYLRSNWYAYIAKISPELEESYALDRKPGDDKTLIQLVKSATPTYIEDTSMFALRCLITGEKSLPRMLASNWAVFDTGSSRFSLLTSDRPIVRLKVLDFPNFQMVLPISPRLVFATFRERRRWRLLTRQEADMLTMESNREVVQGATKFVYGVDTSQKHFIGMNFGIKPAIRLMEHGMSKRFAEV